MIKVDPETLSYFGADAHRMPFLSSLRRRWGIIALIFSLIQLPWQLAMMMISMAIDGGDNPQPPSLWPGALLFVFLILPSICALIFGIRSIKGSQ
jgi:hypothetical protein